MVIFSQFTAVRFGKNWQISKVIKSLVILGKLIKALKTPITTSAQGLASDIRPSFKCLKDCSNICKIQPQKSFISLNQIRLYSHETKN